jgi:predicted HD phosphohydrolase
VWDSKCWKCNNRITVAKDTAGWSFNPFADIGEMWSNSVNENTIRILNKFNVKMELRYSKMANCEYMANVCPYCNNIQGDFFINDEIGDFIYDPTEYFKLVLMHQGNIVDILSSLEEFKSKYWEFYLNNYLESLEQCHICKCYISYTPERIKEYRKNEKAKPILKEYGEIRKRVRHHISYKDNIIIDICPVCHAKVHHSRDPKYVKFRPVDRRNDASSIGSPMR